MCPVDRNPSRPEDIWLDLNYTRICGVGGKSWPGIISDAENGARYAAVGMHLCLCGGGLIDGEQPKKMNGGKVGRPYGCIASLFESGHNTIPLPDRATGSARD